MVYSILAPFAHGDMMKSPLRLILVMSVAALLTGCATATPYQPMKGGYGYQDQQLENNRFRVSFVGNSETPRDTVEDYLLYRAAEITLHHHYDYFVLDHQKTERSTNYVNTYEGFGGYYYDPFFYNPFFSTGTSYPVNRYHAYAIIVLYHGKPPGNDIHAYDARQLVQHLGPRIKNARQPGAGG